MRHLNKSVMGSKAVLLTSLSPSGVDGISSWVSTGGSSGDLALTGWEPQVQFFATEVKSVKLSETSASGRPVRQQS